MGGECVRAVQREGKGVHAQSKRISTVKLSLIADLCVESLKADLKNAEWKRVICAVMVLIVFCTNFVIATAKGDINWHYALQKLYNQKYIPQ